MKIAFLSTGDPVFDRFPDGGGIENQIWGISNELVKQGHEVHILTRNRGFGFMELNGINIHGINTSLDDQVLTRLIFSKNAVHKIKEIKPDVLNLSERFSAYFPSKLDIPKTFTTHNSDAFSFYRKYAYDYNKLNFFFFDIKKKCEENVMLRSNIVIALNKSIERYLQFRGIESKVIPNAIDLSLYKKNGDDNFILYAGRLNKLKGIDYLIKAYSGIQTTHRLMIIGSGPDDCRLKKLVGIHKLTDRVDFIQWVNPYMLREYLSNCSVFVLPSLFETFGIVLLEAMACGKPVIASDIMGPRDIITDGKDGLLFEKGNITDLKSNLEECLADDSFRRKLGMNARINIEENYTFKKITQKLIEVYRCLI